MKDCNVTGWKNVTCLMMSNFSFNNMNVNTGFQAQFNTLFGF